MVALAGVSLAIAAWETGHVEHDLPWGYKGHEFAARAAAQTLPDEMPDFFTDASDQLVWLNPEPDRWRHDDSREMDRAWAYDHYVDLENLPPGALEAPDRFAYLDRLYEARLQNPARDGGFLPYRIIEVHQRLVRGWARWYESGPDSDERRWIQERIIHDAGVLGHYVSDASQPHHTTIHFNGWSRGVSNPEGYTEDRDFHARFERFFVDAHVDFTDIESRVRSTPEDLRSRVRHSVHEMIETTFAEVEPMYRLDRDVGFEPDLPADSVALAFVSDRIAAGSMMLASLWYSAWLEGKP